MNEIVELEKRPKRKIVADKRRVLSLMKRLQIKGIPVIIYRNDKQLNLSKEKSNNVPIIEAVKDGDLIKEGSWYKRLNKGIKPSALYEFKRYKNTIELIHKKRDHNKYKFVFISDKYAVEYLDLLINGRNY